MDQFYMQKALQLAALAEGMTSPNPMVGALVVKNGRIVGHGYHHRAGTPHAEVHALREAGEQARGATLYVTLEPCCHFGRTPPCTDAVIAAGIRRVVIAMQDPNPLVAGRGVALLRQAGIEVTEDVMADQAARLNEVFLKWVTTGRPFTVVKTAVTLDGKIATSGGQSQWITGEMARHYVHRLRNRYDAIMVGIGTVLADNPRLTTRLPDGPGHNPLRVIVDANARTPLTAEVVTDGAAKTLLAVADDAPAAAVQALSSTGVEIVRIPRSANGLALPALFDYLAKREITSVMLEGGAALTASAFQNQLVDKLYWFIAPKIIGGSKAPGPVGGEGVHALIDAYRVHNITLQKIGEDLLLTGSVTGEDETQICSPELLKR